MQAAGLVFTKVNYTLYILQYEEYFKLCHLEITFVILPVE